MMAKVMSAVHQLIMNITAKQRRAPNNDSHCKERQNEFLLYHAQLVNTLNQFLVADT